MWNTMRTHLIHNFEFKPLRAKTLILDCLCRRWMCWAICLINPQLVMLWSFKGDDKRYMRPLGKPLITLGSCCLALIDQFSWFHWSSVLMNNVWFLFYAMKWIWFVRMQCNAYDLYMKWGGQILGCYTYLTDRPCVGCGIITIVLW